MADKRRPHVLILMPDQLRADCLSSAGHPVVRTPNIDRIAAEGVRFANAYTTSPVCMPARSSVLSGLFCHNHGQWWNYGHLPPDADTYLRHLKRAGYHACHVGKSHLYPHGIGHLNDMLGFMRALGWDDCLETTGPWATVTTESIMTDHWREVGCLELFREDYRKRAACRPDQATWPSPMPEGETLDDFIGRTAVDYVSGYDRDEPLCLFVGFGGPHEPWDPPASWADRYDPAQTEPAKPLDRPGHWVGTAAREYQMDFRRHPALPAEKISAVRARYYAKISHIDDWIGRILDEFEARGMLEDTCIVFWSDHGEMLGDKERLYKSVFYDEAAKVPLIVRRPGAAGAGATADGLASLVDIFPTVLELAGCEAAEGAFGRSLVGALDDPSAPIHDAVFSEILQYTMVRDARYKFALNRAGETIMLYDMAEDPEERNNLAGKADARGIEARLRGRLLRWLLETATDQNPSRESKGP